MITANEPLGPERCFQPHWRVSRRSSLFISKHLNYYEVCFGSLSTWKNNCPLILLNIPLLPLLTTYKNKLLIQKFGEKKVCPAFSSTTFTLHTSSLPQCLFLCLCPSVLPSAVCLRVHFYHLLYTPPSSTLHIINTHENSVHGPALTNTKEHCK